MAKLHKGCQKQPSTIYSHCCQYKQHLVLFAFFHFGKYFLSPVFILNLRTTLFEARSLQSKELSSFFSFLCQTFSNAIVLQPKHS